MSARVVTDGMLQEALVLEILAEKISIDEESEQAQYNQCFELLGEGLSLGPVKKTIRNVLEIRKFQQSKRNANKSKRRKKSAVVEDDSDAQLAAKVKAVTLIDRRAQEKALDLMGVISKFTDVYETPNVEGTPRDVEDPLDAGLKKFQKSNAKLMSLISRVVCSQSGASLPQELVKPSENFLRDCRKKRSYDL